MSEVLEPPRLSTALREIPPQVGRRFTDEGEQQPAAIHNEYWSVRRERAGHDQRCDGQQILVTVSQELTSDSDRNFKREQIALLEWALA
jgi:hypothetical protein